MKFSLLDPHWMSADGRERMGILFQCPACLSENRGHGLGHYLAVYFSNPADGGPPATPKHVPSPRWRRDGDTFDDLTISPSIDAGCWHGFITKGETSTC